MSAHLAEALAQVILPVLLGMEVSVDGGMEYQQPPLSDLADLAEEIARGIAPLLESNNGNGNGERP